MECLRERHHLRIALPQGSDPLDRPPLHVASHNLVFWIILIFHKYLVFTSIMLCTSINSRVCVCLSSNKTSARRAVRDSL